MRYGDHNNQEEQYPTMRNQAQHDQTDTMSISSVSTGDASRLSSLSASTFNSSVPRHPHLPPHHAHPHHAASKGTAATTATTVTTGVASLQLPAAAGTIPKAAASIPSISSTSLEANDDEHRAIHRIKLSALRHNYDYVSSCANIQKCSVIVVVKADGYGHGAVETALHLADYCGADAFAVATLEEGIALRKAFSGVVKEEMGKKGVVSGVLPVVKPLPTNDGKKSKISNNGTNFDLPQTIEATPQTSHKALLNSRTTSPVPPSSVDIPKPQPLPQPIAAPPPKNMRPSKIRILVLGPPLNFPRCFDLYYHYDIEVMVSGSEVAQSLVTWVVQAEERKKKEVERAAMEVKEEVLSNVQYMHGHPGRNEVVRQSTVWSTSSDEESDADDDDDNNNNDNDNEEKEETSSKKQDQNQTNSKTSNSTNSSSTTTSTTSNTSSTQKTNSHKNTSSTSPPPPPPLPSDELLPTFPPTQQQTQMQAATLSNVSGMNLAREVRAILMSQQAAVAAKQTTTTTTGTTTNAEASVSTAVVSNETKKSGSNSPPTSLGLSSLYGNSEDAKKGAPPRTNAITNENGGTNTAAAGAGGGGTTLFRGIADAAKMSRHKQLKAAGRKQQQPNSTSSGYQNHDTTTTTIPPLPKQNQQQQQQQQQQQPPPVRQKKLKWHALVDSGMGRLGFKPEKIEDTLAFSQAATTTTSSSNHHTMIQHENHTEDEDMEDDIVYWKAESTKNAKEVGSGGYGYGYGASGSMIGANGIGMPKQRDTVDILKEMYDMEVHDGAPIEFFGMCTHMADASNSSNSNYTSAQMDRFVSLLNRVRDAGISVPTVSTDNSAALLTTSLTHFQPHAILSQPHLDTRGYVRTGGAIYGQRPAFKELRAVSTLMASVRHVAVLREGESVGYDRAYIAPFDVRIATLTIGFADGYPRELGNGVGQVSIRGEVFPVAGNVCMDMLMVELGPVGENVESSSSSNSVVGAQVCVGDVAILWGPESGGGVHEEEGDGLIKLVDIASKLKTTPSALTCGLDKTRVRRQYL